MNKETLRKREPAVVPNTDFYVSILAWIGGFCLGAWTVLLKLGRFEPIMLVIGVCFTLVWVFYYAKHSKIYGSRQGA